MLWAGSRKVLSLIVSDENELQGGVAVQWNQEL